MRQVSRPEQTLSASYSREENPGRRGAKCRFRGQHGVQVHRLESNVIDPQSDSADRTLFLAGRSTEKRCSLHFANAVSTPVRLALGVRSIDRLACSCRHFATKGIKRAAPN